MKKIIRFLSAILLILWFNTSFAQSEIEGDYEGVLKVPGMSLEMNINLQNDGSAWRGDLDITKQNIKNMVLVDLMIKGDSLSFRLPEVPGNANFAGILKRDQIVGIFRQSGSTIDLTFSKVDEMVDLTMYADRITKLADSILSVANVAGLGIGIIYKDQLVLSQGFGYRNLESKKKVDENTLFAIGSTTKAFTAAGLAKLVSDGKLKWDEPIKKHLPGFELHDDYATMHMNSIDILCHRSGLPRHDLIWYGTPFSREELLSKLKYAKPNKSFRETWQYQNLMFMTAGLLAEAVSGMSWEDFTHESFFGPLGMDDTNFSVEASKINENAAVPYKYDEDKKEQVKMDFRNIDAIGPAGSINSSVADMLKWVKFQLNSGKIDDHEVINSGDFAMMHRPAMIMNGADRFDGRSGRTYGLAWMIHHYDGLKIVEHGGNIDGFSAHVLLVPEKQLGMVLLANRNGTPLPSMLSYEIVDLMLEKESGGYLASVYKDREEEEEESSEQDEIDKITGTNLSKKLEDYTGTYQHEAYGEIQVGLLDAENLKAKYYSLYIPLVHLHYDVFEGEIEGLGEKTKIQFHLDFKGEIASLSTIMEPTMDPIFFEKQGNENFNDVAYLKTFLGAYKTADLVFKIELKNNKLHISPAGQPSFELVPIRKNKFKPLELAGYTIEFIESDRSIKSAKLNQPNGVFRAEKIK